MGEIGIERDTFLYKMRLWEIRAVVRGYRRRARTVWKAVRQHGWWILQALGNKNLHTAQDLMPFTWEKEAAHEDDITPEEIEAIRKHLNEVNAQMEAAGGSMPESKPTE